jgi:VanZ family protein
MFLRHNAIGILWMLFIFCACLLPGKDVPDGPFVSFDKAFHIIAYAILSFQLIVGLKKQYSFVKLKHLTIRIVLIFCIVYGILMELFQRFMLSDRIADIYDVIANSIGAFIGWGLFVWVYHPRKEETSA